MTRYAIDLGIVLRQIRHYRGFSQIEAAKALGVNVAMYVYYEMGKIVDMLMMKKFSELFSVPLDAFCHPEKYEGKYNFIETDATDAP